MSIFQLLISQVSYTIVYTNDRDATLAKATRTLRVFILYIYIPTYKMIQIQMHTATLVLVALFIALQSALSELPVIRMARV